MFQRQQDICSITHYFVEMNLISLIFTVTALFNIIRVEGLFLAFLECFREKSISDIRPNLPFDSLLSPEFLNIFMVRIH